VAVEIKYCYHIKVFNLLESASLIKGVSAVVIRVVFVFVQDFLCVCIYIVLIVVCVYIYIYIYIYIYFVFE